MDSGGESKREGEGAAKEPSSSLPHPLAPDPPTVIALPPSPPLSWLRTIFGGGRVRKGGAGGGGEERREEGRRGVRRVCSEEIFF